MGLTRGSLRAQLTSCWVSASWLQVQCEPASYSWPHGCPGWWTVSWNKPFLPALMYSLSCVCTQRWVRWLVECLLFGFILQASPVERRLFPGASAKNPKGWMLIFQKPEQQPPLSARKTDKGTKESRVYYWEDIWGQHERRKHSIPTKATQSRQPQDYDFHPTVKESCICFLLLL